MNTIVKPPVKTPNKAPEKNPEPSSHSRSAARSMFDPVIVMPAIATNASRPANSSNGRESLGGSGNSIWLKPVAPIRSNGAGKLPPVRWKKHLRTTMAARANTASAGNGRPGNGEGGACHTSVGPLPPSNALSPNAAKVSPIGPRRASTYQPTPNRHRVSDDKTFVATSRHR